MFPCIHNKHPFQEAPCHSSPDTLLVPLQDAIDITTSYSVSIIRPIHCHKTNEIGFSLKPDNTKVYSSGQYSIASQHYDPELSTVSVTVPDLSYHLQVVQTLQPLLRDFCLFQYFNLVLSGVRGSGYTYHPGHGISTDIFRLPVGRSGKDLDPSSYLIPRVRFKTSKSVQSSI